LPPEHPGLAATVEPFVEHALVKLRPGGRLVAVLANGPRQRERLLPIASAWTDLPPGSFKEQGTRVRAAIVVIQT
jgi:hypothetical protein